LGKREALPHLNYLGEMPRLPPSLLLWWGSLRGEGITGRNFENFAARKLRPEVRKLMIKYNFVAVQ